MDVEVAPVRGAEADPDVVAGVHVDPYGIWVTWTFGDRDIQGPVRVLVRDDWVVSAVAYVGGRRVASAASRVLNSAGAATIAAAAVIAAAVPCPCGAIRLEDDVDVVAVRHLPPTHVNLRCAAGRLAAPWAGDAARSGAGVTGEPLPSRSVPWLSGVSRLRSASKPLRSAIGSSIRDCPGMPSVRRAPGECLPVRDLPVQCRPMGDVRWAVRVRETGLP